MYSRPYSEASSGQGWLENWTACHRSVCAAHSTWRPTTSHVMIQQGTTQHSCHETRGHNKPPPSRSDQNAALPTPCILHTTMSHTQAAATSWLQHTTMHHNAPQHTTMHHNAPQHTTMHHSTPQCTTAHHNAPQHTTAHHSRKHTTCPAHQSPINWSLRHNHTSLAITCHHTDTAGNATQLNTHTRHGQGTNTRGGTHDIMSQQVR
jgi:hypothetical protein